MATRSLIGIVNKGGSISAIYNHFDGYPQGVGVQLALNYGEKQAKRLINLGNRSSLFSYPTKKGAYKYPASGITDPYYPEDAKTYKDFKEFADHAVRTDVRYVYIGQQVAGYGFAWEAYSVEYGPDHDIAKGIIDKSLKRLGIIRPEVKFEKLALPDLIS